MFMEYLVQHLLENSARRLPGKVAVVCNEERLSYAEVNACADCVAGWLRGAGIKRQDRVALFLDNSTESIVALFGVLKADAIFVMPSAVMKARKLNFILRDSGARVLITHQSKSAVVNEAVADLPDLHTVVWAGDQQGNHHSPALENVSLEEVLSSRCSVPQPRNIDFDLAAIIYTSGTTGEPKGVMAAHANLLSAVRSIAAYLESGESDIILSTLPLSFGYGLCQVLTTFYSGGTLILGKSFVFPYKILEQLARERATGMPIVPTMAAMLLKLDFTKLDLSHLQYITNAASALPVAHIRRLQDLLPGVRIYSMYGLTECIRVSYLPPAELDRKPGSVGVPMPNEEVFVVDEHGREVGPHSVGELVVRGSNVMRGYWNASNETAKKFRTGRYPGEALLHTGDLFYRDEDGYLYFVARMDDIIKTKGERVSPKEVEDVLCGLGGVAESAVIGVPDELLGQAIKAFIVPEGTSALTQRDVLGHCHRNLEPFMIPKYVEFVESLPKTANGKVYKKQLNTQI